MQHLDYSFRYSVVLINYSLLTTTLLPDYKNTRLQGHIIHTLFYDVLAEYDCI